MSIKALIRWICRLKGDNSESIVFLKCCGLQNSIEIYGINYISTEIKKCTEKKEVESLILQWKSRSL